MNRFFSSKFFLLAPALLCTLILFGGGIFFSFLQTGGWNPSQETWTFSLDTFSHLFSMPAFWQSTRLTATIAVCSTLLGAILSILLSLLIMRLAPRSKVVQFFLQLAIAAPHLLIAVAALFLLSPTGMFSRLFMALGLIAGPGDFPYLVQDDLYIGVILVYLWKEVPFITAMLLPVLHQQGKALDEVGQVFGCSCYQRCIHITLPVILPSLSGACTLVYAYIFSAFEVPALLGKSGPLLLPIWAYTRYTEPDLLSRPEGIAMGLCIAAFVILSLGLAGLILHVYKKRLSVIC